MTAVPIAGDTVTFAGSELYCLGTQTESWTRYVVFVSPDGRSDDLIFADADRLPTLTVVETCALTRLLAVVYAIACAARDAAEFVDHLKGRAA